MKRSIRMKLFSSMSIIILLFIFAIAAQTNGQNMVNGLQENVTQHQNELINLANLGLSIATTQQSASNYLMSTNEQTRNEYLEQYEESARSVSELIESGKKTDLDATLQALNSFESKWNAYLTEMEQVFALYEKGDVSGAQAAFLSVSLDQSGNGEAHSQLEQGITELEAEADRQVSLSSILTVAVALITTILGVIIALLISGKMAKTLQQVNKQLKEIAEGEADLTQSIKVNSKDEIGELAHYFNQMLAHLRSLIQQVASSTVHVASSAHALSSGSDQTKEAISQITLFTHEVAEGTESQVNALQHNVVTINEMSDAIKHVAASTHDVSESANESLSLAAEGNGLIQNAIKQMESISNSMYSLSEVVKGLETRSREIDQIISVITEIASQTNLLALNAGIEAARAGEQGAGFSVVAEEVKKLAEQSSSSASKITELVRSIQGDTAQAIMSMETSIRDVTDGSTIIAQAGESFEHIEQSVTGVAHQVQEVSSAVEQMSASAEEIVTSIQFVSQMAEEVASGTQTISAATEEQLASMEAVSEASHKLLGLSDQLESLVNKFKV